MNDAGTLAHLRRRSARTENLGTLRDIADAASELAAVAPEALLPEIASLQERAAGAASASPSYEAIAEGSRPSEVALSDHTVASATM
jgi:hypothetical protein